MATAVSAQVPPGERDALIALYDSTDGANWTNNTKWLGAAGTECTWHGVACSGGHVQQLVLFLNNMSGDIPPELGNLSRTQYFYLHDNQLTGTIPVEIEGLSSVLYLWLFNNQLSGSIPPVLATLSSLQSLNLHSNLLVGNIPPELGALSNLFYLNLSHNQLTGTIPPELGDLTDLHSLYLNSNHLNGSIPPELADLSELLDLGLSENRLSGSIPPELKMLSNLEYLWLPDNQLTGSIPPELGSLSSLLFLNLSSNRLGGRIPLKLTNLTNLWPYLSDIGYNGLWTDEPTLRSFLDAKAPGWEQTQTIAPEDITVVSVADHTVWLEWTPIMYTDDRGGYEVFSEEIGREKVSGGFTANKLTSTFPVTGLQPGQTHAFTAAAFTRPHAMNRNAVVSNLSTSVQATTGDSGCAAPEVTVTGTSVPFTLSVTSAHDSFDWSTGESTSSISVAPHREAWYWVKTTGPGPCDESAVGFVDVLFFDGFETADTSLWTGSDHGP